MVERSLQASPAGIHLANLALIDKRLNQTELARALAITRQPISKFFNGKPIDRELFVRICEYLSLDWKDIADLPPMPSTDVTESQQESKFDIHELVQGIRQAISNSVRKRCGTIRVLDMTQPIALTGEQGIYTQVNILEKVLGRRRLGVEELLQNWDLEAFDRVGLGQVKEERVPGLEAAQQHPKLIVLGKPGAGKTTFLKFLAMQCIEGLFLGDRVPIFVMLKDFAEADGQPDLLAYIDWQVIPIAQRVYAAGKALLLLDGLDEVWEEDTDRPRSSVATPC